MRSDFVQPNKKLLLGFGLLVLLGLVANQLVLQHIKRSALRNIRESSAYPAHMGVVTGWVPGGYLHARKIDFRSRLGDATLHWQVPRLKVNLAAFDLLRGRTVFQSIRANQGNLVVSIPQSGALSTSFAAHGESRNRRPELSSGAVWCQNLQIDFSQMVWMAPQGSFPLASQGQLNCFPFSMVQGQVVYPMHLHMEARLLEGQAEPRLVGTGYHDPGQSSFNCDLNLTGVGLAWLDQFDFGHHGAASDWLLSGSMGIRFQAEVVPQQVSGAITLALDSVQFDQQSSQFMSLPESYRNWLAIVSDAPGAVRLGPVRFSQPLDGRPLTVWEQIVAGMVAELIRLSPDEAFKTGQSWLKGLFN